MKVRTPPAPVPAAVPVSKAMGQNRRAKFKHSPFPIFLTAYFMDHRDTSTAAYSTEERRNSFSFLNTRCDLFSVDLSFPRLQPFPRTFNLARIKKMCSNDRISCPENAGSRITIVLVISPNERYYVTSFELNR